MKITLNANNIVAGYDVKLKTYDYETGKAVIVIKLDNQVISAEIQKQIK
jgi:hypothetical protein